MTCEYPQLLSRLRVQLLAGDLVIAEIEDPSLWQRVLADSFGKPTRPDAMPAVVEPLMAVAEPPMVVAAPPMVVAAPPTAVAEPLTAASEPPAAESGGAESSPEAEASINTNTAAGRRAYDAEVLAALREIKRTTGAWVSSEQLRPRVGGTPPQLGASLRRLCAMGELHWTGVARGTKYIAAAEPETPAE
jgi:hypothetical protein